MGRTLKRWFGLFTGVLSFGYLIFVLNPIQTLSVVIYPFSKRLCREVNRWCARSIWGLWVLMAERQNNVEIRVVGDVVPKRENALLLSNHQTMADVMVLLAFAWRCGRVGDMKWFVKDIIKYLPGVGWGMLFLDCVFVKRNWMRDEAGIFRLFAKYKRNDIPIFLVSFLEGTRMTPEKLKESQAFAQKRGRYAPDYTLVPRTKGFVATMKGLNDHLDAVYDITIGYPKPVPTLMDCFASKVDRVDVHVRRHPVASFDVADEQALTEWVFDRYREKDERLAAFAKTERFEGEPWTDVVRPSDWFASESRRTGPSEPA